jgi:hypothetical protein
MSISWYRACDRRMKSLALVLLLPVGLAAFASPALCVPALPDVTSITQPDGRIVKVYLRGDEWNNWVETVAGYTIAQGRGGYWYYVTRYDGKSPVLSGVKAGRGHAPAGTQKHLRPILEEVPPPDGLQR